MKDIEDEIPFDVPEGWAWCRLKNICLEFIVPQRDKPTTFDGNIPWCRIEDIEGKYLNGSLSNQLVSMETIKKMNMHICPKGSIICSCSASLGVQAIVTVDCCTNQTFIGIVPKHEVLFNEYLYYFLGAQTKYFNEIATGTTIKYISRDKFENLLFPLPPIMEQEKTVSAIEHYFSLINAIENDKSDLQTAIKQAKSKILDLAIHGKLVPQDSSDEPASVLLEKLRTEKEAKLKAGELKRDKNDSYIYKNTTDNCYYQKFADGKEVDITDEIPYEVPSSWGWCRFGDYLDVRDGTHDSPKYVDNGFPFVTSKNLIDGKIDFSDVKYISEKDHKNFIQRSFVEDGDILFAMIGSIGNPVLVKKDREFSIKNVALFKPLSKSINYMKYVFFFADHIQTELTKKAKGGMQPFVPLSFFRKDLWIPIPPLAEQKRIVEKIENFYSILDKIAENLA